MGIGTAKLAFVGFWSRSALILTTVRIRATLRSSIRWRPESSLVQQKTVSASPFMEGCARVMAENPRLERAQQSSSNSITGESLGPVNLFPRNQTSQEITNIARKITAHGGGSASLDLALDLVLHDIVEHARDTTGATGAAVALANGSEMVCRATTGKNAPDLGVRVETATGLVRACLSTGDTQYCGDAETNSEANRAVCQSLGVRSMLVIPLTDADHIFGLLEVFSSSPNAFGDKEIVFLRSLARRVADTISDVRQNSSADPVHGDLMQQAHESEVANQGRDAGALPEQPEQPNPSQMDLVPSQKVAASRTGELWTTVLFVVVIAAAIALGIVVGRSGGVKARTNRTPSKLIDTDVTNTQNAKNPSTAGDSSSTPSSVSPPSSQIKNSLSIPDGGLVVTQNGKIIYRSFASQTSNGQGRTRSGQADRRLIHRVEPDYPPDARAQHIAGTVVLDAQIRPDGQVGTVLVVSGEPLLTDAAIKAVKQWRYQPNANTVQTRISLNFALPAD